MPVPAVLSLRRALAVLAWSASWCPRCRWRSRSTASAAITRPDRDLGPLIGAAFIGTGLFAWLRRPENRFGGLMVVVGFSYSLSGLVVSTEPWVFIAGLALLPLPYAILYHVLLAFPTGRLQAPVERVLVIVSYASATVLHGSRCCSRTRPGRGCPRTTCWSRTSPTCCGRGSTPASASG